MEHETILLLLKIIAGAYVVWLIADWNKRTDKNH